MLDATFANAFPASGDITLKAFLICDGAALVLGTLMALAYMFRTVYTKGFVTTLAVLPAVVCVIIMMVGGNLGAGVAVAGTFSLVRFRSAPGTAKEICAVFLAMAVGLACGMGYPGFGGVFAVIMVLFTMLLTLVNFGGRKNEDRRKVLRITVPEDLDYGSIFADILEKYTREAALASVKTSNLGSLNRLSYNVVLKEDGSEKAMIDELRTRNGNLEISLSIQANELQTL